MSDPKMIKEIMDTVTIPVMAKARIGHFVECQVRPLIFLLSLAAINLTLALKSCFTANLSTSTAKTDIVNIDPRSPGRRLH